MKLLKSLCLLLPLVGACGHQPSTKMAPIKFNLKMLDLSFPSGLRVVVQEDHTHPFIAIAMAVGAGGADDPKGKEGLAHVVEHLAFLGKPSGGSKVWDLLESRGVAFNAFTEFDTTVYQDLFPSDEQTLRDVLTLEAHRLTEPLAGVTEEMFVTEREVVRNELRNGYETGSGLVQEWLMEMTFPRDHRYGRHMEVIGTHQTLLSTKLADAVLFTRKHYRPGNVTLVIAGDVDMKNIDRILTKVLPMELMGEAKIVPASPPRITEANIADPQAPPAQAKLRTETARVSMPEVLVAWPMPHGIGKQAVINDLVAQSVTGAVAEAAEVDDDMLSAGCQAQNLIHGSQLVCSATLLEGTHPEKSAERILDQIFKSWGSENQKFEQALLAEQLLFTKAMTALGAEDLLGRAVQLAQYTHWHGKPDYYSKTLAQYDAIEQSTIPSTAAKLVTRDKARILYVVPEYKNQGFASAQVKSIAPGHRVATLAKFSDLSTTTNAFDKFDPAIAKALVRLPDFGTMKRFKLDNGLSVIVNKEANIPVVSVGLWIPGGNADTQIWGLPRWAFQTSQSESKLLRMMYKFAGTYSSGASDHDLRFMYHAPAGNLEQLLTALSSQVQGLEADRGRFQRLNKYFLPVHQKQQQLNSEVAHRALLGLLFGEGNILARSDYDIAEIGKLGKADVDQWIKQAIVPNQAVLVVSGDVDPAQVESLVRAHLSAWKGGGNVARKEHAPPKMPQGGSLRVVDRPEATQTEVQLACRLPDADPAQNILYQVMSSYIRKALFDTVRAKLGAIYSPGVGVMSHPGGTSALRISLNVENDKNAGAFAVVNDFLASAAAGDINEKNLALAHYQVARQSGLGYGTSEAFVSNVIGMLYLGYPPETLAKLDEHLGSVTKEKVAAAFATCKKTLVGVMIGKEAVVRAAVEKSGLGSL